MDFLQPLQLLWDYMALRQPLRKADVIVGFGCYDDKVACRAAQLYLDGFAPRILFTGGMGRNTAGRISASEAECFARVAMDMGVPKSAILLETKSANTKENILFSQSLLEENGIPHGHILGVHKPYMERRIAAAMGVYWPCQRFCVTSFPQSLLDALADAPRQGIREEELVSTIVGDFQRIDLYAKLGYQLPQYIPQEAWDAFYKLVALGFDQQLAK